MATIRERRTGVWEVRGYTGRDREGNPTQVSRTVHGTKRDAQRAAAELTVKPARNAGGRKVGQLGQIIVSTIDGVRAPRLQPTKTGSRRVVTLSPSTRRDGRGEGGEVRRGDRVAVHP